MHMSSQVYIKKTITDYDSIMYHSFDYASVKFIIIPPLVHLLTPYDYL